MGIGASAKAVTGGFLASGVKKGVGYAIRNPIQVGGMAMEGLGAIQSIKQSDSFVGGVAKEALNMALYHTNPGLMMALQLAPAAYHGTKALHEFRENRTKEIFDMTYNQYGRVGGGYRDTYQAQTMRQAAVQQIQGNKLNARSALGGEARLFAHNARGVITR